MTASDAGPPVGTWSFSGLTPDDAGKRVREVAQTDWAATVGGDGFLIVNPGSGGAQTGLDFGNVFGFTISGRKVQDNDGDGDIAEEATFPGGFTIFIDDDGDGVFDPGERSTVTASDGTGSWSITDLISADAGKRVYEVDPERLDADRGYGWLPHRRSGPRRRADRARLRQLRELHDLRPQGAGHRR